MKGIDASHTLWSDPARTRFFLVPDEAVLPRGDFEIRTVTGKRQEVDPFVVAHLEVSRDEARAWLDAQFGQMLARVKASVIGFLEECWKPTRSA